MRLPVSLKAARLLDNDYIGFLPLVTHQQRKTKYLPSASLTLPKANDATPVVTGVAEDRAPLAWGHLL